MKHCDRSIETISGQRAPAPSAPMRTERCLTDDIINALDGLSNAADELRATGNPVMSKCVFGATQVLRTAIFAQQPAPSAPVGMANMEKLIDSWENVGFGADYIKALRQAVCDDRALTQQPTAVDGGDHIFALQELADNEGTGTFINSTDAAALRAAIKALAQRP